MSGHTEDSTYALLTDGATVEIRPARPADFAAVQIAELELSHAAPEPSEARP